MTTFFQWLLIVGLCVFIGYNVVGIIKTVRDRRRANENKKNSEKADEGQDRS